MPISNTVSLLGALRVAARSMTNGPPSDPETTIRKIVRSAVDTVAPAVGAGISRTAEGTVHSAYGTSEDVRRLDQLQSELQQGPCITAADRPPASGMVYAGNLGGSDHDRWPLFASQAAGMGYHSMLSLHLSGAKGHNSALNLYALERDAFDEEAQTTASLFRLQAAVLLHGVKDTANLRRALETRDLIGQAKGVLTERFHLGDDDAFQMLVEVSQTTNTRLVDVARGVLADARRPRRGPMSEAAPT